MNQGVAETIEVVPLSPEIGAEIRGVNLAQPLDARTRQILLAAWNEHVILLFRDQQLDDAQLKHAADWLGVLGQRTMPAGIRKDTDLFITLLSNQRDEEGKLTNPLGDGEMWFHHDNCFVPTPHKATFLYCTEADVQGGHTLFSNCYRAYETLPDHLKQAIEGRQVLMVYSYTVNEKADISKLDDLKHHWQPAVIVNPDTGRRALYMDRLMSAAISGYSKEESDALLEAIVPYVERRDYEHPWRAGDFLVWDNRCSAHARTDFITQGPRVLKRSTVIGAPLVAAW